MEIEEKKGKCPIVDVDGVIANGKQFDIDVTLPEDHRDVIYGVVKNCFKEPVRDAVVKLIEVVKDCGKEERTPVSHTFTDKEGEFVFGPLCPGKSYAIQIWVNKVKHVKLCTKGHHEGDCLKGTKLDCDCNEDYKYEYEDKPHYPEYKPEYKPDCKSNCKQECKPEHKPDCKHDCKQEYKPDCKEECKPDYKPNCKQECKPEYKPDCKHDCYR